MKIPCYALRCLTLALVTSVAMAAGAAGGGPVEEIGLQGRQALASLTAELSRRAGHVPEPAARCPRPDRPPVLRIARTGARGRPELTLAR